jgi:hypothetical protein
MNLWYGLSAAFVVSQVAARLIRKRYHVAIDGWRDRQIAHSVRFYRFMRSIVTFGAYDDRTEAERKIAGEV